MTVCKLKLQGRKLNLMAKIDNWIEDSLDNIRLQNSLTNGDLTEADLQKHHENLVKIADEIVNKGTYTKHVKKLDQFHNNTNQKIEY